MQPALEQLLSRWRALELRERIVIAGGTVIALVMLFYAFAWMPMQRDLSQLRVNVPKTRAELALMRVQAREVKKLQAGGGPVGTAGNLLTKLERSAVERGLRQNISRMEPDGDHAVRLALDGIRFNDLVRWLADLHQQAGVRADTATISAEASTGVVNARLLLRRPGS
ncbi:MAG: type II secretion system protein GspM [Acidiferrobacterales bacterium]